MSTKRFAYRLQGGHGPFARPWGFLLGLSVVLIGYQSSLSWAQTTQPTALPEVTVRGTTPLMSIPLPQEEIPVNTQVATGDEYRAGGALNLTDFFARDLAGVSL